MSQNPSVNQAREFWTGLYRSAYGEFDASLDSETLTPLIGELKAMFRTRRHLAVTEMPIDGLKGRRVLEVGPGAGGHAALFAKRGPVRKARGNRYRRGSLLRSRAGDGNKIRFAR